MTKSEVRIGLRRVYTRLRDLEGSDLDPRARVEIEGIREAVAAIGKQLADDVAKPKVRGRWNSGRQAGAGAGRSWAR